MPYITGYASQRYHQITLDELLDGISEEVLKQEDYAMTNTRTYVTEYINEKKLERIDIDGMISCLCEFNQKHAALYEAERKDLYYSFSIPKRSGGLRRIDAPDKELMEALRQLKFIFETRLFALYHTSAFAYISGRCTINALEKHKQNESKWFCKMDFSNFFGSTTLEFTLSQLSIIFPFNEIMKNKEGKIQLTKAVELCFLNGGLPQGTPISPLLTNLLMIPLDHKLSNTFRNFEKQSYVYTRYCDDIIISSKHDFKHKKAYDFIIEVIREFNAPYQLNPEKTRYGSSSGGNWNLGLMLNKNNEITVGHKKKKQFKAMINNFASDYLKGNDWAKSDVQELSGIMSYYKMVEKPYIEYILTHYSEKFKFDIRKIIKDKLK